VKVVASSSDASIAAASDVNVTHGAIDHVLIEPSATELRATKTSASPRGPLMHSTTGSRAPE
jgi:hypothetical protein